jgi:hypothetical protein
MLWLLLLIGATFAAGDWTSHALRLTGESALVRAEAIEKLKATPDIDKVLVAALTTEKKYLALDAITALERHAMVPELLERARGEDDAALLLTANSLLTTANKPKIVAAYRERMSPKRRSESSLAAQAVMLDTLARTGAILPDDEIKGLLGDPAPEIRSAALYYLRFLLRRVKRAEHVELAAGLLKDRAYQIRVQAWLLLRDTPGLPMKKWNPQCEAEENTEVRAVCFPLVGVGE